MAVDSKGIDGIGKVAILLYANFSRQRYPKNVASDSSFSWDKGYNISKGKSLRDETRRRGDGTRARCCCAQRNEG